jgi:hypothetical protein
MCFVDLCRAASKTPPHNELVLRSFAPEIADEIKVSFPVSIDCLNPVDLT